MKNISFDSDSDEMISSSIEGLKETLVFTCTSCNEIPEIKIIDDKLKIHCFRCNYNNIENFDYILNIFNKKPRCKNHPDLFAVKYCIDSHRFLCIKCLQKDRELNPDHKYCNYMFQSGCSIHNEKRNYYCPKCKVHICSFCEELHSKHGCILINKISEEEQKKLWITISKVREKICTIDEKTSKMIPIIKIGTKKENLRSALSKFLDRNKKIVNIIELMLEGCLETSDRDYYSIKNIRDIIFNEIMFNFNQGPNCEDRLIEFLNKYQVAISKVNDDKEFEVKTNQHEVSEKDKNLLEFFIKILKEISTNQEDHTNFPNSNEVIEEKFEEIELFSKENKESKETTHYVYEVSSLKKKLDITFTFDDSNIIFTVIDTSSLLNRYEGIFSLSTIADKNNIFSSCKTTEACFKFLTKKVFETKNYSFEISEKGLKMVWKIKNYFDEEESCEFFIPLLKINPETKINNLYSAVGKLINQNKQLINQNKQLIKENNELKNRIEKINSRFDSLKEMCAEFIKENHY